jgi:hypothetical protein
VYRAERLGYADCPDSLVSSQVYEIIKTIYATTADATPNPISNEAVDATPRIKVLQSTLGQLRLNNIATLDALATHFTRLIDLTSADEAFVTALAQSLAPCILRPRTENSLTLEERHSYRLIRDLFDHKEAIFGELKRQSSTLSGSNSVSNRQRAVSKSEPDESSRRANMEARARAITEQRQRDKSPGPTNRHRRDKSTDGSLGRFPVIASPRPDRDHGRSISGVGLPSKRASLEVPDMDSSPVQNRNQAAVDRNSTIRTEARGNVTNGHEHDSPDTVMPGAFSGGGPGPHIPPPLDDDSGESDAPPPAPPSKDEDAPSSRVGSLKRSEARDPSSSVGSLKRAAAVGRNASGSIKRNPVPQVQGVQLTDRPMDMDDFS